MQLYQRVFKKCIATLICTHISTCGCVYQRLYVFYHRVYVLIDVYSKMYISMLASVVKKSWM